MQPIPLPEQKWQQITIDLVTDLPQSDGKNTIAVFVDRLSKMVHFAPCTKEILAEKYGQLFIDHVFKHHGLPEVIIFDKDPKFTSRFWKELFQKLKTDLKFSTAFHPQTDGQSEVTIRGGQTFPKSTEIRNSVAFCAFFSGFFHPFLSMVADSVSEQLLQRTDGLGGQFWLSKESVSTSAMDCRISAPICTKYGLQKSILVSLMDCISYVKYLANTYIQSRKAESMFWWGACGRQKGTKSFL